MFCEENRVRNYHNLYIKLILITHNLKYSEQIQYNEKLECVDSIAFTHIFKKSGRNMSRMHHQVLTKY